MSGLQVPKIVAQINNISNITTPEMFGAIGDGMHDDSDAIQKANDSIKTTGGVISFFTKKYAINKQINDYF